MPRKKAKIPQPDGPAVVKVNHRIPSPPRKRRPVVLSDRVTARRPMQAPGSSKRRVSAIVAGEACALFGLRHGKGGGAAFARWCASAAIDLTAKPFEEWQPLLEQFAARPIHGHRRTKAGGNHRINKQHRR